MLEPAGDQVAWSFWGMLSKSEKNMLNNDLTAHVLFFIWKIQTDRY